MGKKKRPAELRMKAAAVSCETEGKKGPCGKKRRDRHFRDEMDRKIVISSLAANVEGEEKNGLFHLLVAVSAKK